MKNFAALFVVIALGAMSALSALVSSHNIIRTSSLSATTVTGGRLNVGKFAVVPTLTQTYMLTASPSTVSSGETITVTWTAPAGRPANDWIGLYRVGDPETSYISYQYTAGAASGSVPFTAPNQGGQYEFRYFTDDSYNKVASSNTVTVGGLALPQGFAASQVATGLTQPIAMAFAPDGRLFICEQGGSLRVVKNGNLLPTPFLTLTNIDSWGERGLLGVAFDPDFNTNNFVYVFYTATSPTLHNRISRFTANGDVAVPNSEVVIFDFADQTADANNGQGGAMNFGADGKLYVAVGIHSYSSEAQVLTSLWGKMLRLNRDGTIPVDNPYFNDPSVTGQSKAIWARGLRVPFTFSVQPGSGRIFINDIGEHSWEEVNEGVAAANYGWNITEGPTTDPAFRSPLFVYANGTGSEQGCAITGGAFYNPPVNHFPAQYTGIYFYTDFCSGWIRHFDPSNPTSSSAFASGLSFPVDLKVAPDGGLYYLERNTGNAYRIGYSQIPTPTPTPTPTPGPGYTVMASPSTVSPGQTITVTWTAPAGRPANDWIGFYKVGDPETSYISYQYTAGAASGSVPFTAPSQGGSYEFRYFIDDSYNRVATSNTVTVGGAPTPTPTPTPMPTPTPTPTPTPVPSYSVTASPSTVGVGETITVTWTAPAGRPANDWIGLHRVGDPETSYISYQYTAGAASGSVSFTAPSQAGQYEFRYFTDDSYNRVATSNAVTVGGFTAVQVTSGISNPTAMAFAPDGRLFVCQQTGQLRVVKDGVLLPTPFTSVTVNSSGERGLLGVTFDPDFASNQWVYVYYTSTSPSIHNRVTRFTAAGDVAVVGSEVAILELNNLSAATNHNGGAIHFGPDNKLYIAVGENANPANSQTLGNLLGKMLRINPDGSIPEDNPFFATAVGNNRAIWALGLRNPYTFAFQPGTGRMLVNDVGQTTWEEINDGIAMSNYGWNICEGSCGNPSFRDPIFQYGHGAGAATGCAITGGAFYNPPLVTYPSDYVGKYFYADFCSGWIRRFDPMSGNSEAFVSGLTSPVDLQVGSDGNLYYLVRGGGGSVFKIVYG
ncbi:MAG: PQQ-dependent sugar dehydrogenase [Acidobacteriota bacterium]|nr:PQQ-dependent sugar dehydrogenase [Acidobacteriota bacterium]